MVTVRCLLVVSLSWSVLEVLGVGGITNVDQNIIAEEDRRAAEVITGKKNELNPSDTSIRSLFVTSGEGAHHPSLYPSGLAHHGLYGGNGPSYSYGPSAYGGQYYPPEYYPNEHYHHPEYEHHGLEPHGGFIKHALALKGFLIPLAGIALLGAAAALAANPVLLQLGVVNGRRRRRRRHLVDVPPTIDLINGPQRRKRQIVH